MSSYDRDMPWDGIIPEDDLRVYEASGYGAVQEFGSRPALLVIDVTYNFCGDRREPILEAIKSYRNSCGDAAWDAIEHLRDELLPVARDNDVPVLYTRGRSLQRPADLGGWNRKNARAAEDLEKGEHIHEIVAEIAPQPQDHVFEKEKPSGFFGTGLTSRLIDLGVDTLFVTGGTTSGCIRATVLDAFSLNFRVGVVQDATFDRGRVSHAVNLFDMASKYANCLTAEAAVSHLRGK